MRHLKSSDPILKQIIGQVGPYAIQYRPAEFSTLVRSIVYQQISGKAAVTVIGRMVAACGKLTPTSILRLTPEELRACGLSGQKASYIRDLAEKTRSRQLRFPPLAALSDDDVIAHLTQVKGIGVWTAQMFLMFALKRHDILPTADLGIRAAMKRSYELEALPKPEQMIEIAEPWRPWATVASWYLWRSLDGSAEI
ncbi:MAG: DNA-3-methyladenine glycosylase [Acidobacteria bacterium]|nr:DNA-3-methyladenine glycosylase [Acidobacteriota bacterium]